MSTTLVSFVGTGRRENKDDSRSAYATTTYRFSLPGGREYLQTTSLFGTALLRFLRERGTQIDRWIVLGTSASLWSELNHVLADPNCVLEQYCQIDDHVVSRTVNATELQTWEEALNTHAAPLQLRLCLTGDALDPTSQQQIARALFDNVRRGNDLVFDITHGYRHQPVIATFLVSLMRWTHSIQNISFFSGVFEARQGDVAPVLELPICQQLVDATEAAAVLHVTGNYEPIASYLGLDASLPWFLENTNQINIARNQVQQLDTQVAGLTDIVSVELARLLRERLQWSTQGAFASRCLQSAQTALERGEYFRAIVLGYEAILIRAGQILYLSADPLNYQTRLQSESDLFDRLLGDDRELLVTLQWTRNACAHGTQPNRANIQRVMRNPSEFRALLRQAFALFERVESLLT